MSLHISQKSEVREKRKKKERNEVVSPAISACILCFDLLDMIIFRILLDILLVAKRQWN